MKVSEIRRDMVKNNWVAIATDRALKPNDFPIAKKGVETSEVQGFCPFCEGNEKFTPPEIAAYRPGNQEADASGWSIRAIPNKFSAFNLEGELEEKQKGIYCTYNGLGQHEVIIETPKHGLAFYQFDLDRIAMIIKMLKNRYNDLSSDPRIKYIQIYKNSGMFGGASLEHSHSQIVSLPLVPVENAGIPDYYQEKGNCLICEMMKQEKEEGERLIYETEHFMLICPYASRFSYETWVIPKRHCEHFGEINETEIQELAKISQKYTQAMFEGLGNPSYNFIINTAPVNVPYKEGFHWYMEINPRLLVQAGVEVATGFFINPVAPELAASILRENFLKIW